MARPIDDIGDVIRTALIEAFKDREAELKAIAEAGGAKAGPGLFQDVGSIVGIITDVIQAVPIVGQLIGLPLEPLKHLESQAGGGGRAFGFGYLLGSAAFQAMDPVLQPLNHAVADLLQTGIFDPQTVAQLQARGIVDDAYGRSEAAGGNMSGEHYDKLVDAAQDRPAIGQVLDMWLKRQISEDDVNAALKHHTIPEFWWGPIKALRRQFLSPADLALANLRGNITDTVLTEYSAELGVTPDDMTVLVENTGEPPGIMEMLFLFRRGLIDQDRMTRAIRQSRIRNEWVDAVMDLRFAPMTTADAARAVVEGYMTVDEGGKVAEQNGLVAEHWPIIVESWGRPPSHEQMMTLYHRKQATLEQVKQAFKESDIKDKYIQQLIDLGRTLIPERLLVQALSRGVITHQEAHTALTERGYNDTDAETLIKLGSAERVSTQHALSRTDIVQMYTDSLMTRQVAHDHLTKLGYTEADATALLQLADAKAEASQRRVVIRGVESSVQAHRITEQEAINQLEAAGVDNTQARSLVSSWLKVRGQATRTLTEAQTVKAGQEGIISPQQAYDRLRAMGYDQDDTLILLRVAGLPPGSGIEFH